MDISNTNSSTQNDFQWRIRLGTILGFPFFFHLSFFLWFIGLFWVEKNRLILFISLLVFSIFVHELAHAIVCRWLGLGGGTLTIWFLGGYFLPFSQISLFDMHHGQRLRYVLMIFAGPLSNVMLSGFFISLAYITSMDALYVAAKYNLALALLNLLPVGMLDGGRMLAYLASTLVNWRRAIFLAGVLSLALAVGIFVGIFSNHWIDRYTNLAGFLIVMGIKTIKESRKSEDEIRTEAQNQISKEISFVDKTNQANARPFSIAIFVGLMSLMVYSICYLGCAYVIYRNLPGRIVYVDFDSGRNGNLYAVSGMGFPVEKIPQNVMNPYYPSSSNDGNITVFLCASSQYSQSTSLCVFDRRDGFVHEIPLSDKLAISSVLVSPSGNLIVFSSLEEGLWAVNVATREIRQLHVAGILEAWSPDENHLLITTRIESGEILLFDLRDHSVVQLTNKPDSYSSPTFSQDGKQIYYALGNVVGMSNLYRMDIDGLNLVGFALNDTIYRFSKFQLSPDDSKIVFECGIDGGLICVANLDDSHLNRIAEGKFPVWSPDGQYIAYSSVNDSKGIFVVRPDGKFPYQIGGTAWGTYLEWIP